MSRLRKPRQWAATHRMAGKAGWSGGGGMVAPTPTCTPTQTPSQTPITTPITTPSRPTVAGRDESQGTSTSASGSCCAVVAAGQLYPCAEAGEEPAPAAAAAAARPAAGMSALLPPVPTFSSRFSASPVKAAVATGGGVSGCGKGDGSSGETGGRAGPFAGQGRLFGGGGGGLGVGRGGGGGRGGRCCGDSPKAGPGGEVVGLVCGKEKRQDEECVEERRKRVVPSIEAEVGARIDYGVKDCCDTVC